MALEQLDKSQFLELVSALVALGTAALGGLALAGLALWKVRPADPRAALAIGLAGIAQALALLVAGILGYVRPAGELVKFGAEQSVFTWLMLLPAAQVAIVLSLLLLAIDALVAFAMISLSARARSTPSSPA